MVLYGLLTRYGVAWGSYKMWCCMGFLQDMVLCGVLKVGLACLVARKKREASALLDLASKGSTPPIRAKDCWTEPYSYS